MCDVVRCQLRTYLLYLRTQPEAFAISMNTNVRYGRIAKLHGELEGRDKWQTQVNQ
jgi:hypothetical protein